MVGFCEESKLERVGKILIPIFGQRPAVEGKEKREELTKLEAGFLSLW